jgi:hypothetical protein
MGDDMGQDDQFNEGIFRSTIHNSKRSAPDQWPATTTMMRKHTEYGNQGMAAHRDDAHSKFMTSRRPAGQVGPEAFQHGRAYEPRQARTRDGFQHGRAYDPRQARTRDGFQHGRAYDPRQQKQTREGYRGGQYGPSYSRHREQIYDPNRREWIWVDKKR